jgi:hypothetical protein
VGWVDAELVLVSLAAMLSPTTLSFSTTRTASAVAQMSRVASSTAIAVVGAGAMLANPGAFIPIALKTISELDPSTAQYIADWVFFTVLAVLPLLLAIVALIVRRVWAERMLAAARTWLESHVRAVAAAIVVLLALSLLRNGIAGLVG